MSVAKKYGYGGLGVLLILGGYGHAWLLRSWITRELSAHNIVLTSPTPSFSRITVAEIKFPNGLTLHNVSFYQPFWQWNSGNYRIGDLTFSRPGIDITAHAITGRITYYKPTLDFDFSAAEGTLTSPVKTLPLQGRGHIIYYPKRFTFQACTLESEQSSIETSGSIALPDKTGKVKLKVMGSMDLIAAFFTLMTSNDKTVQQVIHTLDSKSLDLSFTLDRGKIYWGVLPIGSF